jgi:hypothetical protein
LPRGRCMRRPRTLSSTTRCHSDSGGSLSIITDPVLGALRGSVPELWIALTGQTATAALFTPSMLGLGGSSDACAIHNCRGSFIGRLGRSSPVAWVLPCRGTVPSRWSDGQDRPQRCLLLDQAALTTGGHRGAWLVCTIAAVLLVTRIRSAARRRQKAARRRCLKPPSDRSC